MPPFALVGSSVARSGKGRPVSGLSAQSRLKSSRWRLPETELFVSIGFADSASPRSVIIVIRPPFLPTGSSVLFLPPFGKSPPAAAAGCGLAAAAGLAPVAAVEAAAGLAAPVVAAG